MVAVTGLLMEYKRNSDCVCKGMLRSMVNGISSTLTYLHFAVLGVAGAALLVVDSCAMLGKATALSTRKMREGILKLAFIVQSRE